MGQEVFLLLLLIMELFLYGQVKQSPFPLECKKLQGFPDGWTNIEKFSDSGRYKALGNSVAIPCVDFIMRGIAYFLRKFKEEGDE